MGFTYTRNASGERFLHPVPLSLLARGRFVCTLGAHAALSHMFPHHGRIRISFLDGEPRYEKDPHIDARKRRRGKGA